MTDNHVLPAPPRGREAEMSTPVDPVATSDQQATNAQKAIAALKVGMKISGRYLLLSRLAIGGMGEVWQSLDEKTGERLALKILRPELAGKKLFLSRLQIEAYNASRVHHPNLAAVHASGEDGGLGWISMELVDGVSLTEILDRERTLSADFLISVLYQTADALRAVHGAGIVHRDIKPGNIMVTPTGEVKLTDFGISKAPGQANLTQVGMVMGTAQYLPPEQAMGQPATPAGDLYALGIIAYEALVGKRPFSGEKPVDIAFAHVNKPVPALPESIPVALRELVMQLLEKEPQNRLASAERLMQRLEEVQISLTHPHLEEQEHPSLQESLNLSPQSQEAAGIDLEAGVLSEPAAELENSQEDLEELTELEKMHHNAAAVKKSIELQLPSPTSSPLPAETTPAPGAASGSNWRPPFAASWPKEEDGSRMLYLSGGTVPAPPVLPDSIPLPEGAWDQRIRQRQRPREFAELIPPVSASRPRSQMQRLRALPHVFNWRKAPAPPRYATPDTPETEKTASSLAAPLVSWSHRLESQIGLHPADSLDAEVARLRCPYEKVAFFSHKWWKQDISRARHGRQNRNTALPLVLVTLILWILVTALSFGISLLFSEANSSEASTQKAMINIVSEQKEDTWQILHTA
ncbi:serine/threonine-protein kinase [Varibaculum vaginae]|uniref:serine/threonine-protein kinase n=1 Tax=Varibaculum vaginae TaxID=2364797 RepID=UPI000F0747D1|nr:serine/threonine-protein kinase [Varibaculum vaginae]